MIQPPKGGKFKPIDRWLLGEIARRIVAESHAKTQPTQGGYRQTPIGKGGKIDDTSCLVGQVVEWTNAHGEAWAKIRSERSWHNLLTCGGQIPACERSHEYVVDDDGPANGGTRPRNYP